MTMEKAWRRWRAVRIELARTLTEAQQPSAAVTVGRRRHVDPAQLEATPPPGWASISPEAAQRFRAMIDAKAQRLAAASPWTPAPSAMEGRARRLEREARRLAAEIHARPVTTRADVLARLDVIAAMWEADGSIREPGAPLADVLALMDDLARQSPGTPTTWREVRRLRMEDDRPES